MEVIKKDLEDIEKMVLENTKKIDENAKANKENTDRIIKNMEKLHSHDEQIKENSFALEILRDMKKYLGYFEQQRKGLDFNLYNIFSYGLWDELTGYIDKYLSLSKKKDFRFLAEGSTTSCYKIGDFVFKLNRFKWSYEEELCPNLYLILKNLEEHYIRDDKGCIVAGIEVQKYLSRRDIIITDEHIKWFEQELRRLGYYVNDSLVYGSKGDNCLLLDMIYKVKNRRPKQLRERWS